ncbi:type II toxin-antitoxin system VapC family toxin [Rhizobium herbae]|uniref:Type II toxin-antitoxin system VapC family toxin n=2 Tax=Rhizobium herbae TaxID=508661 RepID=A0ABS7H6I0_9HYPH|nr:type II toxin-antitoxin system VapC family toxin [Rhizobium herbae]MBW9062420.1 type II toxin-antitoxin system VapC family toxin [Rhizobium herbae]
MYRLDTGVVSELRRPRPRGAVLAWIAATDERMLAISAITIGEIQQGIEAAQKQDIARARMIEVWLGQLMQSMSVLPLDGQCMIQWAKLMHRRPSHLVAEAMIAATATVHGLIIVTRNGQGFRAFPGESAQSL